ncbi:TonB-dependent siderophore receptor [Bordetella genomosp. 12]|uniref:TonB-dependent siderophore receptor n=1 Tax=Bordetella genomosp. 12 TaxID=463035 RepID=A0A261VEA0_9BORD|nr:TonB-dependent siderophore receptor [Bordetella genomosp. 12]OZI71910.1 TonB-dependent siderophore receptor [Bordetella genomosp. 12]
MQVPALPAALALALASTVLLPPTAAQAAEPATAQQRSYNIPAGSLDQVLNRYAQDAGVMLTVDGALTAGRQSAGLRGSYGLNDGFAAILSGSGLAAVTQGSGYVLRRLPPQSGDVATLAPVSVSGSGAAGDATYVAETSRAGSKTETSILDVPQSISVITRRQMEAQNAQSVTEVLRYVPGVNVETYGIDPKGFDWVMIRGFNAQSSSDYKDGLRQGGSGYTLFRSEPFALERIEVLRGPSSVLYGQGDAGGIINRVSKMPQATPHYEAELEYGTYQRKQAAVDLTGPVNEDATLMYRVIGVARNANTQFTYPNGDRIEDDRRYIAPSFTWAPSADTRFTLMAEYLRDRSGGTIGTVTINGKPTNMRNGDPNFNRFDQDQKSVGYLFEHRFNETFQVRQSMRYGQVNAILDNLLLSGLGATGIQRVARRFDETMANFAMDNQLQADFKTGPLAHTVLVGLDYNRVHADARRDTGSAPALNPYNPVYGIDVPTPSTPIYDGLERTYQTGLYLQDQIKIAERWMLTVGGRYDWYEQKLENRLSQVDSKQTGEHFTGRVGLNYVFANGVAPYVSYAQSFLPNSGTTATGSTFSPSQARQWEAGVKYQPVGSSALYTVAVFDIRKTNVLTNDLSNPGFAIAAGEVKSRGVELEGKFSLGSGWDFTGSYTFVDAEISRSNDGTKGNRPSLVPEHSASGWLNYTFRDSLLAGLSVGAGVRYVGSTYGNNTNTLKIDSHTLVDAGLSYTYDKQLTFSVNATNLFDKDYLATCSDLTDCYPGNKRAVIGRVKYKF